MIETFETFYKYNNIIYIPGDPIGPCAPVEPI